MTQQSTEQDENATRMDTMGSPIDSRTASAGVPESAKDIAAEWRSFGVVELAIRNPNVASYVAHWEARALTAERLLNDAVNYARLERAIDEFDCPHDAEARCGCARSIKTWIAKASAMRDRLIDVAGLPAVGREVVVDSGQTPPRAEDPDPLTRG